MVFQCINIRQVPRDVLKTEAGGTWRMLMHEKPCLIPIINHKHYDETRQRAQFQSEIGIQENNKQDHDRYGHRR